MAAGAPRPAPAVPPSPALQACFEQGLALVDDQQWAAAADCFSRGLLIDDRRSGLWHNRAACRLQLGDLAGARADLQQQLQLDPGQPAAMALLARVLLAQGETAAGAALLARAHQAAPDDAVIARQALRASLLLIEAGPGESADAADTAAERALTLARRGQLDEDTALALSGLLALGSAGRATLLRLWRTLCELPPPLAQGWMFEAWSACGQAHGLADEAALAATLWLRHAPGSAPARQRLLALLAGRGDYQALLPMLLHGLVGQPGASAPATEAEAEAEADAMGQLALALFSSMQPEWREAAGLVLSHALDRHPGNASLWAHRGDLRSKLFDSAAALADFEQALRLDPGSRRAVCGAALALAQLDRHGEALARLDDPRFGPASADAWAAAVMVNTRSIVLRAMGRLADAEAALRAALAWGDHPALAVNLGYTLLAQDRYAEGFPLYLRREHTGLPALHWTRALAQGARPWDGDPASARGLRLLVTSENGIGDTFQFGRCLPVLQDLGVQVILHTHPRTGALLQTMHPGVRVVEVGTEAGSAAGTSGRDASVPEADRVCRVMDLPALLRVTLDDLDRFGAAHYLQVPEAERRAMAQRLGPRRGLRVALGWRGTRSALAERSIPLAQLAAMAQAAGLADADGAGPVQWYSLQHGPLTDAQGPDEAADEETAARRLGLQHASWTFSEAAAALLEMDLVVSIDTVYCHLAGALGRPTLIPLPLAADWRWGASGATTPWYPRAHLLRQTRAGDWAAPLAGVAAILRERLGWPALAAAADDLGA